MAIFKGELNGRQERNNNRGSNCHIERTSLPTIVVEGNDDMIVYRTFEEKLCSIGVSVLPVGGREKVLEVYLRRSELPSASRPIFIADRDTWVISGIPAEYRDGCLVFTRGYSIENDVYIDGALRKLLRATECARYAAELVDFIEWYALAVNRHLGDRTQPIALHPDHVLNPAERPKLLALNPGETYPTELRDTIANDYQYLLRGKSLLAILVRNTNYKGREPRHTHNALLEAVAVRPGVLLNQLYERVEQFFSPVGVSG